MKKRFLCVLTIVCMIITMSPIGVFAATTYDLWVGGVQVTGSNASDVLGDGTVSYDASSNTLILKDANITGTYAMENYRFGICSLIEKNLTIKYEGINTITVPASGSNIYNVGIFLYSGALEIIAKNTNNNDVINVNVGSSYYTSGIEITGGNFITKYGHLNVNVGDSTGYGSCGITTLGLVDMNNTDADIVVGDAKNGGTTAYGIFSASTGNTYLRGGDLNVTVGDAGAVSAGIYYAGGNYEDRNNTTIISGDVTNPNGTTAAILSEEGSFNFRGKVKLTSGNGGYSCALVALGGTLNVSSGELTATAGNSGIGSSGIGNDSDGISVAKIKVTGGKITATGGTAKAGGHSHGIWIDETMSGISSITWGTIIAKGDDYGIYYNVDDYSSLYFGSDDWYEWRCDKNTRYVSSVGMKIEDTNNYEYLEIRAKSDSLHYNGVVSRLAGLDRFGTSAEISKALVAQDSAEAIVIVNGFDFPDALAAVPFAHSVEAPILMVNGNTGEIKGTVLDEINRIDTDHNAKVYIIGGTGAVNQTAVDTLENIGYMDIERVYGINRYSTAIEVAKKVDAKRAFIVNGATYPDALGASSAAALNEGVILFTATDYLTPATKDYLMQENFDEIVIIGGVGAVDANVEAQLKNICNNVQRIYGATRYETSLQVAKQYFASPDNIFIATGLDFADALAGGPLAAKFNGPIILANNYLFQLPQETKAYIGFNDTKSVTILGGTGVVSASIQNNIEKIIRGSSAK